MRFLAQAHHLATQVARATAVIPPPAGLVATADAWRSFAASRSARLRPGDLALVDWSLRGVPLTLTRRFEAERVVASELGMPPRGRGRRHLAGRAREGHGLRQLRRGRAGWASRCRKLTIRRALLTTAEAFTIAVGEPLGGEISPYR